MHRGPPPPRWARHLPLGGGGLWRWRRCIAGPLRLAGLGTSPWEGEDWWGISQSSPFRGRWPGGPEGAHQRALHREVLPLQGSCTRTRCAFLRQGTVSSVAAGSWLTARASAGDSVPQTPPGFRGELRPPRTPPAGGLLRTSPWTPCAGPVPSGDGSQSSKAGVWSRAGCRVRGSMGSGDDEPMGWCQIRRFVR